MSFVLINVTITNSSQINYENLTRFNLNIVGFIDQSCVLYSCLRQSYDDYD